MNFLKNIIVIVLLSGALVSKPIIIKLATVAPEGTEYYNLLLEMGQRWQEETNGQVQLRIYPNGVVGGEIDTIRKMRIGQIQASAMSSIGLARLTDSIQAFTLPMGFKDYNEVDRVKDAMFDDIHDELSDSGFELLFLVDIGWVYWFSSDEIIVPQDLKDSKIFTSAGDYVTVELFKKFGFNAIPMSETDILTGLQTGMINSMQTVPILAASSGWSALMPNMLDLKWGAFIGAVIIDNKVWSKIKPEHKKAMMIVAKDIGRKYQKNGREMEIKAIDAMEQYGMKVKTPNDKELEVWESFKNEITPDVIDTFLSEEIYNKVTSAIDEQ
jgi:TRAP-type C4-dicarboxylate transport system substrate-binding protein